MLKEKLDNNEYYNVDGLRIPKLPLLTPEEEKDLILKYRNGDMSARDTLVTHNFGLVVKACKEYYCESISKKDLFQEGCIGLINSLDKYKIESGNRFSTCAVWWINQRINSYLYDNICNAKIPREIFYLMSKLNYYQGLLWQKLEREPKPDELAEELGISVQKVNMMLYLLRGELYLDENVKKDNEEYDSYYELIRSDSKPVEDIVSDNNMTKEIIKTLNQPDISEREKDIILERFGFNGDMKSLQEVANKYHLTRERVRQIEAKALKKLKVRYGKHLKTLW